MGDAGVRQRGRLDALTGMRFLAAMYVVAFHSTEMIPDSPLRAVSTVGYAGVAFFFVLSGFVIAWSWRPGPGFYRRRFARIWPLHLVMLVFVVAALPPNVPGSTAGPLAAALLLVHAWIPSYRFVWAGDLTSWSLACEAFFYALTPLLMLRQRPVRFWRLAGMVLTAAVLVGIVVASVSPNANLALYFSPWFRLAEFLTGLWLGRAFAAGWRPPVGWRPAAVLVVGLLVGFTVLDPASLWLVGTLMAVPFGLLIAGLAQAERDGARLWLAHPAMVRLGEWSFALYLVHQPMQIMLYPHRSTAWLAVDVVASIALAGVLHHAVEKPCERRLRRVSTPARPELEAARA